MMRFPYGPLRRMLLLCWIPACLSAHVLTVGIGSDFDNLSSAAGRASPGDTVLFRSGAYDGGDYSTPSHHLVFERCTFRDMESEDNNDLLKLSGVDAFEVRECAFLNGFSGGNGIDMVGCHNGKIRGNRFNNMGSNAIQAKGGSSFVRTDVTNNTLSFTSGISTLRPTSGRIRGRKGL